MQKFRLLIYILLIFLTVTPAVSYAAQAKITRLSPSKTSINQYEAFELDISVSASYKNPYDPEQIDLQASVTTPDGMKLNVPAFFTGSGSAWQIRYTPTKPGKHSYRLRLKTPEETYASDIGYFDVKSGDKNGFLRNAKHNPYYIVFDSGKSFFGLGHNVAWVTDNNVSTFENYFIDLKKNGCNLTRIWLNAPWTFCVETEKLGFYNFRDSAKVDSIIQSAEKHGIYIILVLDTYGSLMEEIGPWGENTWKVNPYNKTKGGPCEKAWDFFTNEEAKKYYKNRLRYIVSRWSYSPHVMAFELWNEVDTPREWLREMASYMKSVNPHGQFITTTPGYPWGNNFDESEIYGLKDIDIAELHVYGNQVNDVIGYLISVNREFLKLYKKPVLIGEFGLDAQKNDKAYDPTGKGVALHNSNWASALSGSFGGTLNWWWAGYVKANKLYFHYQALRNFVEGINWDSTRVEFVKTTPIKVKVPKPGEISYSDIVIKPAEIWGDTRYKDFIIQNNGEVSGGVVNHYLHGSLKKNLKIDPVFHVNYPADGKFVIDVGLVSQGGCLDVYLDEKQVLSKDFPAGPGEGPWKRSLYRKDYKIYQCVYDTTEAIDVPEGRHTIKLINTGKDWVGLKMITLVNYTDNTFAKARLAGLVLDKEILLWIQNRDYNWQNAKKNIEPAEIKDASFDISEVENGSYDIEWWDTYEGKVFSRNKITTENNTLHISLPNFSKDLACKILK